MDTSSHSSNKAIAESTKSIVDAVEDFSRSSSKQSKKMIGLTWAIVVLTIVLIFGLGVQVWLAWK